MDCRCFFDTGSSGYRLGENLIERDYFCEGETVLKTRFQLPKVKTLGAPVLYLKINSYYSNLASQMNNTAALELFPAAAEDFRLARAGDRPFNPHEYGAVFTGTLLNSRLLSLYIDTLLYQGGAHPDTTRASQTWAAQTGELLSLSRFFKQSCRYRDILFTEIRKQAAKMAKEGLIFEDCEALLRQYFDLCNFYLTCDSLVIYYPLYTIAPYASGIIPFHISLETLFCCGCLCDEFTPGQGCESCDGSQNCTFGDIIPPPLYR